MATLTTQILIGRSHLYQGGLNPSHFAFYSENDRDAWIIVRENIFDNPQKKVTWIPSRNTIDDFFLMIAVHILRDSHIIELFQKYKKKTKPDFWNYFLLLIKSLFPFSMKSVRKSLIGLKWL